MRKALSTTLCAALAVSLLWAPAAAQAAPSPGTAPAPGAATPAPDRGQAKRPRHPDRVADPDRTLPGGWRASADLAVTTSGDETGFHVLVAPEKDAYTWRTVATLTEPGWLTDQWIGQFCVTGSGKRAVVVYAPRQFANKEDLYDRGGYTAIVDLASGKITKLGFGATLAYYNPGCGIGETVAVSRLEPAADATRTRVALVNAASGRVAAQFTAPGQVTSPIPVTGGVLASRGASLVRYDGKGTERLAARTRGTPFRLHPDAAGGVAFQTADSRDVRFHRFAADRVTDVGSAPVGTVKLRPGAGGRVFLAGPGATGRFPANLPGRWKRFDTSPSSQMSTTGALAIARASTGTEAAASDVAVPEVDNLADPVDLTAVTAGGRTVQFTVSPESDAGQRSAPLPQGGAPAGTPSARSGAAGRAATSSYDYSNVPYEPDRVCGVSRNDPQLQTYQPNYAQVEWAVDLAVRNMLPARAANWSNNGLPGYSPQTLYPSQPLATPISGDNQVPAQVLLGILAQESNLWQASWHAVDGTAGNPLTSAGYYGLDGANPDPLRIDWSKHDCGYGVGQVTTGMLLSDRGTSVDGVLITDLHQKAVSTDYAANIAASLRLLQSKWNQTYHAGIRANNGSPRYIENWWFAIWAYNTGFYPDAGGQAPWGVGWSNNPANPKYPADRQMFLTAPLQNKPYGNPPTYDQSGYDNARHPSDWSYPERVIGFAYESLRKKDWKTGSTRSTYQRAAIPSGVDIRTSQPDKLAFCAPWSIELGGNQCAPGTTNPNDLGDPAGPCTRPDLKCWWHAPKSWVDCATRCGTEVRTFTTVEPRPYYTSIYPEQCAVSGLPSGAKIIDDIDVTVKTGPNGCTPNYTKGGRFSLRFPGHQHLGNTVYPAKVDFHQIGAGFGGHFWFTHTLWDSSGNQPLKVTGTWNINPVNAWTRVFVHIPDHGAHTRQAKYKINLPNGQQRFRVVNQRQERNVWIEIGVFDFTGSGSPSIELSNFTATDHGRNLDIAWDAIAIQTLPGRPEHMVVSMGDSYASGEGTSDYDPASNMHGFDGQGSMGMNSCRRSPHAWGQILALSGAPGSFAQRKAAYDANLSYQMISCSGAKSHNLMRFGSLSPNGRTAVGQHWELPQLEQGYVDADTTLVLLAIGGNDARFGPVLAGCVIGAAPTSPCQDQILSGELTDEFGVKTPFTDDEPLRVEEEKLVKNVMFPAVQQIVDQIAVAAPNARILLMGYPRLTDGYEQGGPLGLAICPDGLSTAETTWLNSVGDLIAAEVLLKVAHPRLIKGDVRTAFSMHGACSPNPWINGLDLTPSGGGDVEPGMGMDSFHPNQSGQAMFALQARDRLAEHGVVW